MGNWNLGLLNDKCLCFLQQVRFGHAFISHDFLGMIGSNIIEHFVPSGLSLIIDLSRGNPSASGNSGRGFPLRRAVRVVP
jgi:hypothetical protein